VNPLAVRTPKSPQPKPNGESIKEGQYKAVKPNPFASAFGATLRSGPWEISLFLQNLIEGNANSQYHRITLLTGPPGLVPFEGRGFGSKEDGAVAGAFHPVRGVEAVHDDPCVQAPGELHYHSPR